MNIAFVFVWILKVIALLRIVISIEYMIQWWNKNIIRLIYCICGEPRWSIYTARVIHADRYMWRDWSTLIDTCGVIDPRWIDICAVLHCLIRAPPLSYPVGYHPFEYLRLISLVKLYTSHRYWACLTGVWCSFVLRYDWSNMWFALPYARLIVFDFRFLYTPSHFRSNWACYWHCLCTCE